MTMLYMNDSTHEQTLIEVKPIEIKKYREGINAFEATGSHEQIRGASSHDINVLFDQNTVLDGRCGIGVIISDEQATTLRAKSADVLAARRAAYVPPTAIQTGAACYSCGRERNVQNGECVHCGADAQ